MSKKILSYIDSLKHWLRHLSKKQLFIFGAIGTSTLAFAVVVTVLVMYNSGKVIEVIKNEINVATGNSTSYPASYLVTSFPTSYVGEEIEYNDGSMGEEATSYPVSYNNLTPEQQSMYYDTLSPVTSSELSNLVVAGYKFYILKSNGELGKRVISNHKIIDYKIAPDNKSIVYTVDTGRAIPWWSTDYINFSRMYIFDLESQQSTTISEFADNFAFSPKGNSLLFEEKATANYNQILSIYDINSRQKYTLVEGIVTGFDGLFSTARFARWSEDEQYMIVDSMDAFQKGYNLFELGNNNKYTYKSTINCLKGKEYLSLEAIEGGYGIFSKQEEISNYMETRVIYVVDLDNDEIKTEYTSDKQILFDNLGEFYTNSDNTFTKHKINSQGEIETLSSYTVPNIKRMYKLIPLSNKDYTNVRSKTALFGVKDNWENIILVDIEKGKFFDFEELFTQNKQTIDQCRNMVNETKDFYVVNFGKSGNSCQYNPKIATVKKADKSVRYIN